MRNQKKQQQTTSKLITMVAILPTINLKFKNMLQEKPRKKQRDYTIPIRLNQQTSTINNQEDNINHKMLNTHNRNKLFKLRNYLKMIILSISIFAIFNINLVICDMLTTKTTKESPIPVKPPASINLSAQKPTIIKQTLQLMSTSTRKPDAQSQRAKLMSTLDSIERQHLKMNQMKVFGASKKRPSKFDSGDDFTQELFASPSSISAATSTTYLRPIANKPSYGYITDDDPMRSILSKHQQAAVHYQHHSNNMHNSKQPLTSLNQNDDASSSSASNNRWIDVKKSVRVASNLVNSNKVISQVFSYISPLISSSKLLKDQINQQNPHFDETLRPSSSILSHFKINKLDGEGGISNGFESMPFNRNKSNDTSSVKTKLRSLVSPYVARSINNHLFGGLIGKSSGSAGVSASSSSNNFFHLPLTSVTSLPQTSFLVKPQFGSSEFATPPTSQLIDIDTTRDLMVADSDIKPVISTALINQPHQAETNDKLITSSTTRSAQTTTGSVSKFKNHQMAHNYIQDSFRGLLTLTQLPILPAGHQISTAPSIHERPKYSKTTTASNQSSISPLLSSQARPISLFSLFTDEQRRRAIEELYRYAYILGTGVRRKRDPLHALGSSSVHSQISPLMKFKSNQNSLQSPSQRTTQQSDNQSNKNFSDNTAKRLRAILNLEALDSSLKKAKPRGVMWEMATDPSLAVTVFHLLERASVALPLGFLLMPFVHMIRNPFSHIGLARILPPRASHRSVDYEELAKRLDVVDKMLSKALRSTHRDSSLVGR